MPFAKAPIRLAVDLSNLRPGGENGGVKPFLFELLRWLGRQRRAALQFVYLTGSSTHAEVRDELARLGDEVVCVRDQGGPQPRSDGAAPYERLFLPPPADLLWRLDVRVLYCPFGHPEFALPGISTICTVVDVLHRDFPWSLGPHHNAARERAFQEIVAVADALQCNSEHVIARMHEHFGVARERMFTVYNAVHGRFAAFRPAGTAATARTAPFFFYPANAWKHKNHEVLLVAYGMYRAATRAAGQTPWPLVLTGHEDERWDEMRALAQTLDVLGEDAARFVGYVPAEEFGRLWETAGALVFPSLHEGFGIPPLEAMEHDVPVLCSREGSLPEVGADACLFVDARRPGELAEAMTRLATDAALRKSLVEAGRHRLLDFSLDHEAGKLLDAVVTWSAAMPPYRPFVRGIYPDGWTDPAAVLALPTASLPGTVTLRFHPMPQPRRLRLRAGVATFGGFDLPPDRLDTEISITLHPRGDALTLEIPDAVNLSPADGRTHGVRLRSVDLRHADGQEHALFAAR